MRISPYSQLLRDNFAPCANIDFSKKELLHLKLNTLVRKIQSPHPENMRNGDESHELSKILTSMSFPYFYRGINPRDFHTALDLVQDFQMKVFELILDGTLDPDRNVPSYLFAIERSILQRHNRNSTRRRMAIDNPKDIPSVHGVDSSVRWRLTSKSKDGEIDLGNIPTSKDFDPAERIAKLNLELRFGYILEKALESLSPRERVVFELRIFEGLTLDDIGKDPRAYGESNQPVTRERIRQLYAKALNKVQDTFRSSDFIQEHFSYILKGKSSRVGRPVFRGDEVLNGGINGSPSQERQDENLESGITG